MPSSPQGSRFFHFDIQNFRGATASGVDAPHGKSVGIMLLCTENSAVFFVCRYEGPTDYREMCFYGGISIYLVGNQPREIVNVCWDVSKRNEDLQESSSPLYDIMMEDITKTIIIVFYEIREYTEISGRLTVSKTSCTGSYYSRRVDLGNRRFRKIPISPSHVFREQFPVRDFGGKCTYLFLINELDLKYEILFMNICGVCLKYVELPFTGYAGMVGRNPCIHHSLEHSTNAVLTFHRLISVTTWSFEFGYKNSPFQFQSKSWDKMLREIEYESFGFVYEIKENLHYFTSKTANHCI